MKKPTPFKSKSKKDRAKVERELREIIDTPTLPGQKNIK